MLGRKTLEEYLTILLCCNVERFWKTFCYKERHITLVSSSVQYLDRHNVDWKDLNDARYYSLERKHLMRKLFAEIEKIILFTDNGVSHPRWNWKFWLFSLSSDTTASCRIEGFHKISKSSTENVFRGIYCKHKRGNMCDDVQVRAESAVTC